LGQLVTLAPLGARQTHPLIGVNPKPPSLRADTLFMIDSEAIEWSCLKAQKDYRPLKKRNLNITVLWFKHTILGVKLKV
jgi:hypothetical protein